MSHHSIHSENEFSGYFNTQHGRNAVRINGQYRDINEYARNLNKYPRAQRAIDYDTRTRKYRYDVRAYQSIPSWLPDLGSQNYHIAQCIKKMHNAFDSVQLAKDLAEACSATARFFGSVPASIRYLRRGNFSKAYTTLVGTSTVRQSIPTTYLQYQWAVRPLISEIEELWEKLNPHEAPLFRISETSGKSAKKSDRVKYGIYNQNIYAHYTQAANASVKVVRYFRHDILDSQGFHFNPLGAIWDGIPWSFLVDWFIPVSDVLKGMSYSIPGCVAGFNNYRYELRTEVTGVTPYEVWSHDHRRSFRIEWPETSFRQYQFYRTPSTSTSLNAAQVNELLWGSPAGLTLKRVLNLFNVAWVFASRK